MVAEEYLPEMLLEEPDVKAFVEEQKSKNKEITDISDAVFSIEVSAIKPWLPFS